MTDVEIAELASKALRLEVETTPKPGLVDKQNNGAHCDMTIDTFYKSIQALGKHFEVFAHIGRTHTELKAEEVFLLLRTAGIKAEQDMFSATGGVNTHKGALFSIGLLCAAVARLQMLSLRVTIDSLCRQVSEMTRGLCRMDYAEAATKKRHTKGEEVFLKYGIMGVREEAESGFSSVRKIAVPLLNQHGRFSRIPKNKIYLNVLMHLLAQVKDSNVFSRGGQAADRYVRENAVHICSSIEPFTKKWLSEIRNFDRRLIERNISPGGCADLLAVSIFFDELFR